MNKLIIVSALFFATTGVFAKEFSFQKSIYCKNDSSSSQNVIEYDEDGNYSSRFVGYQANVIDCKVRSQSLTCTIPNGNKVKLSMPYERVEKHDEYVAVVFADQNAEKEAKSVYGSVIIKPVSLINRIFNEASEIFWPHFFSKKVLRDSLNFLV